MALLNYTTKIPAEQTIGEIQKMLSKHGVMAMMTEYDGQNVSAVSFKMDVQGKPMGFKMPCNWRAVRQIFKEDPSIRNTRLNADEQAIRTAWRIIHTWVRAQLALVEVNMVTIPQVFLPYAIMRDGRTLTEHVETNPGFLLGSGDDV
jgi:hypothetical protein